jgi:hypothetical protein
MTSKDVVSRDYLPWQAACSTDSIKVVGEIERPQYERNIAMNKADRFRAGLERIGELCTRVAPLVRRLLSGESIGETGDSGSDETPDLRGTLRTLRYELKQFATGARLADD